MAEAPKTFLRFLSSKGHSKGALTQPQAPSSAHFGGIRFLQPTAPRFGTRRCRDSMMPWEVAVSVSILFPPPIRDFSSHERALSMPCHALVCHEAEQSGLVNKEVGRTNASEERGRSNEVNKRDLANLGSSYAKGS